VINLKTAKRHSVSKFRPSYWHATEKSLSNSLWQRTVGSSSAVVTRCQRRPVYLRQRKDQESCRSVDADKTILGMQIAPRDRSRRMPLAEQAVMSASFMPGHLRQGCRDGVGLLTGEGPAMTRPNASRFEVTE
jgi:hypothetical protein